MPSRPASGRGIHKLGGGAATHAGQRLGFLLGQPAIEHMRFEFAILRQPAEIGLPAQRIGGNAALPPPWVARAGRLL